MAHSGKTITFATDLLPQEDNTYRLGNTNQRWKVYGETQPIISKIYSGNDLYSSGNSDIGSSFFFISVKPDSWYAPWQIKFRLKTTCAAAVNYQSVTWCTLTGRADSWIIQCWNERYDHAHYYIVNRLLKKAGFDAGLGHAIGVNIRYSNNYTSSSYPRTFELDYYSCEYCTVTVLDNIVKWDAWTNGTDTYYNGWNNANAVDRGFQESGDANSYDLLQMSNNYFINGSSIRIPHYTLMGYDREGRGQAISLYNSTYDGGTTSISTSRVYNTNGIDYTRGMFYNTGGNYAVNAIVTVSTRIAASGIDFRYTDNCVATSGTNTLGMIREKPVYFRGTLGNDGLFYLAPLEVTYNNTTYKRAWTQDIPTQADTYVYWFIGYPYYNGSYAGGLCQINLHAENPLYWFHNGRFEEYKPASTIPWADVTGKPSTATSWPNWSQIQQSGANSLATGSSDVTASTEILTSYASNNGFSDTNGQGIVYKRAASKVVNATLVKAALETDTSTTNQWLNKKGLWSTPTAAQVGAITKLSSSTDNAIVRFDGTAGAVQNSGVTIDDNNNVSVGGTIYFGSNISSGKPILGFNSTYPNYGIWYKDDTNDIISMSSSGNANSGISADFGIQNKKLYNLGNIVPNTGNSTGNVGSTTTPVYVDAGVIKAGTALGASAYHADSYFALSGHDHNSTYLKLDGSNTMTGAVKSSYKSSTWVNSLTSSAITLTDTDGSYGGWICGPTKNGRITISTYQNSTDILYIGYGERGRTENTFARQLTWNGADGTLTATTFSGSGASLTSLNGSNISSGTVAAARIDSAIARLASPAFTGTPTAPTAADGTNTTQIATTAFVMSQFKYNDAMIYKGVVNSNNDLPTTHYQGWTYKVATAGTYAGIACEIGDMIICNTDGTAANDAHWNVIQTNIDGAVTGPTTSKDTGIAIYNGTTGKIIKDSTVKLKVINTQAFGTTGWSQLGCIGTGTTILTIAKPSDTVTWGAAAHSAMLAYGTGDTKGMLDMAYNTPIISFAGGNSGGSTDEAPKWYFKFSATSGSTYTLPGSSKTLAASDGSNATGKWSISTSGKADTAGTADKATAANITTTTNALAYYTNTTGTFGNASNLKVFNDVDITVQNATKKRNGLQLLGATYGNTATDLTSNTRGVMRYEDGGPRIEFVGNGDNAAILFTNHDYANTGGGSSIHFVGQNGSNNTGGNLAVTAPDLVARRRMAIGDNFTNASYTLYVNGNSYLKGDTLISGNVIRIRNANNDNNQAGSQPYVTSLLIGDSSYVALNEYKDDFLQINSKGMILSARSGPIAVYNPENTYTIGTIVWYGKEYYTCKTAITTAEAWNASHWTALSSANTILIEGTLRPISNDTHTLGTESYVWNNVYSKTFTGSVGKGTHTAVVTANEFTPVVGTITVVGNVSNTSMTHSNNANAEMIIKTHPTSGTNYYEARLGFSSDSNLYYMPVNSNTWKQVAYTSSTVDKATAANLTTTTNAIAYYTNTTGTFGTKASANGALYATSANGTLSWGTLPVAQGGTGATTAANARTNLGLGSMATETASNYLKWQATSLASTALYDFGVYRAANTAAGTGPGGSNYYNLINIPYNAASGGSKPYWGWQLGNKSDNDNRLWYRTSGDNVWGDWQTIAHATTSSNNVGSVNQPVYMTAAGVITPVSWYPNYTAISSGNKANYPWHKFAECTTGTGQWTDKTVIVIIHSRYNEGPYGMIKLSMRTNATGTAKGVKAVWLFRYGFKTEDVVITTPTVNSGTDETISAYVKCGTYARRIAYILEGSNVGWNLVSSNEPNDTTASDNKGGTNIFASLSGVTEAIDGASVSYANTAGSADTASLLKVVANTTTTTTSSWNIVPTGGVKVWSQNFKDSTLKWNNNGTETSVTDSGDLVLYLTGSTTANSAWLNMRIDGSIIANGGFTGNLTGNVTGNCSGSSGSCTGNAATVSRATFGDSSNGEHNANNITSNGLWYYSSNGPVSGLGAQSTDGALYSQAYSTSWVGQIAQDYRNGNLFVRSKNNGTWQQWHPIATADSDYVYTTNIAYDPNTRKVTKIGATNNWDAQIYSKIGFKECRVSCQIGTTGQAIMFGLNSDPTTDASYVSLDYCWYIQNNSGQSLSMFESNSSKNSITGHTTYAIGDELAVEYSEGQIRYYHNGVLCRTVDRALGDLLYLDTSFHGASGSIYNIQISSIIHTVATATIANTVNGSYTLNGGQQNPNYFGTNKVGFLMMNTTVNNNSQYKDWIIMDCYNGNDVSGGVAFGVNRQSLGAYIMRSAAARTAWAESAELLGTHNYTTYTVKKDGTGASGTWGISVSGSAATLTTSRKIWGRTFNGSADVTGNLDWDSDTYRQRIAITDDSTADTAVFSFQQSTDSGSTYPDLFVIKDNGTVLAKTFCSSEGTTTLSNNNLTFAQGGGWYMGDSTWIRTVGSKSIYQNTGTLRTDGTFQVGESGKYVQFSSSGIKLGDTTAKANESNLITINGHLVVNAAKNTSNSWNEGIRINNGSNNWSTLAFGGDDETTSTTSKSTWAICVNRHDTTNKVSNMYFSYNGSSSATMRLTGHATNAQETGFSIRPRLSIGTDPNTNYILYSNGATYINGALTVNSTISATGNIGISQTGGTGTGISLYNGAGYTQSYGIFFALTSNFGKHTAVQGDWATYFTMDGASTRGWIFRNKATTTNVASINSAGDAAFTGTITVGDHAKLQYNSTDQSLDFIFI